jgi:ElaB/YqjD/DUF883 family membrane-anchored ribosome-binding protein
MTHAEQLERETEQTRQQIAITLDELRARMTPGHVLDQLADRFSDGAPAAFARNLKDQAINNPLPVVIVGAGLAWLMLGGRGNSSGGLIRSATDHLRDATNDAAENVRSAADATGRAAAGKRAQWSDRASRLRRDAGASVSSLTERARQMAAETGDNVREMASSMAKSAQQTGDQTADAIRENAGSVGDSVQRTASAGYEAVADSARRTANTLTESTKAAGQRTLQTGSTLLDFCREQPLVLTGVAVAVGAVIGALLPPTEAEGRLMGETSDRLKGRAQDLAAEQYESAKNAGERTLGAAQDKPIKQADEEEKATSKDRAPNEASTDGSTLAPAHSADGERPGQPWTAENAPV